VTILQRFSLIIVIVCLFAAGCVLEVPPAPPVFTLEPQFPPTFSLQDSLTAIVTLTAAAPPLPYTNENAVMSGICFEAALARANTQVLLTSADQHIAFYGEIDASGLCRRPVTRYPFEFSNGRALVGTWSVGTGCDAAHEPLDLLRDDSARAIIVRVRFSATSGCNYELIQPFWIGIDNAAGYDVRILVE
jgi:hypothetical protein